MANMNKLRGRIIEAGKSIEEVADSVGINRSTMYRKISSNGETFTIREVNRVIGALHLTPQEAIAIFFTQYVA